MNPVGMEWIRFVHENNVEKVEGGRKYSMTTDNAHRMLLCKDKYFIDEKEYRFILRDERIDNSKTYYFSKLVNSEVMSLDDFKKEDLKDNFLMERQPLSVLFLNKDVVDKAKIHYCLLYLQS